MDSGRIDLFLQVPGETSDGPGLGDGWEDEQETKSIHSCMPRAHCFSASQKAGIMLWESEYSPFVFCMYSGL
jgi:hypothetical protein